MSYKCDCFICRYHNRPFEQDKCPHPRHARWYYREIYLQTNEGRANLRAHDDNAKR